MNNKKSNERSAQPMPGLSKRGQAVAQGKPFRVYSKAHPSPEKREQ